MADFRIRPMTVGVFRELVGKIDGFHPETPLTLDGIPIVEIVWEMKWRDQNPIPSSVDLRFRTER